jgi:hypothetical protein
MKDYRVFIGDKLKLHTVSHPKAALRVLKAEAIQADSVGMMEHGAWDDQWVAFHQLSLVTWI